MVQQQVLCSLRLVVACSKSGTLKPSWNKNYKSQEQAEMAALFLVGEVEEAGGRPTRTSKTQREAISLQGASSAHSSGVERFD